jgi:hypothetical protein
MGFETNPGPPKPGQGEPSPVEENPIPWNPGPDPVPEPGPEPQPDPDVDPDAEKPNINAGGFLRSLAGTWTLSVGGSDWGANAPIGDLEGKVTLEMDAVGGFVGDLPRVEVHQVGMDITVSAAIAGELAVTAFDPATRRYTVEPRNVSFTRREITLSNGETSFGLGFLVGPILDAIVKSSVISGELWVEAWGDQQCLFYTSGGSGQKFVRPGVSGEMVSVSFIDNLELLQTAEMHHLQGVPIHRPHWAQAGARNLAAAYVQGSTVAVDVQVIVRPAGRQYKLFGIAGTPFTSFESATQTATGVAQTIRMHGKAPLTAYLDTHEATIKWSIQTVDHVEQWAVLGPTAHRIHAVWGKPIYRNSFGKDNVITDKRLESAIHFTRKNFKPNSLNVDDIALAVCIAVNNHRDSQSRLVVALGTPVNVVYDETFADQIWGLLDDGYGLHGHCGEATLLMEQALLALGITARQTHVFGRTDKASMDRKENLSFATGADLTGEVSGSAQVRTCQQHGVEVLSLNFSSQGLSINDGEGCVLVNDRLYPGLIRTGDVVGIAHEGMSASQDLLLKLEHIHFKAVRAGDPELKFQVWTHPHLGGQAFCELPPEQSGGGPWCVWVPAP